MLNEASNEASELKELLRVAVGEANALKELLCVAAGEGFKSAGLIKFERLAFDNMAFLGKYAGAQAIKTLEELRGELATLTIIKAVASKTVLAVGGGFSAGKSRFITSFFDSEDFKLPESLKPTTATMSYIVHGENSQILAQNEAGVQTPLSVETYGKITHDFIETLGINIRKIMPNVFIQTPLERYPALCFIDTPGYDAKNDRAIASEAISRANSLLWLVSCESGDIGSADLDMLRQTLQALPKDAELYIVASKAMKVMPSARKEVVDKMVETLINEGLAFCGVSAYDSKKKEEYYHVGESLDEFLTRKNGEEANAKKDEIIDIARSLFSTCYEAIKSEKSSLIRLKNNTYELGITFAQIENEIRDAMKQDLKAAFDISRDFEAALEDKITKLDKDEKRLKEVSTEFEACLDEIFTEIFGTKTKKVNLKSEVSFNDDRVFASAAGRVSRVSIKSGDIVSNKQTLLTIETYSTPYTALGGPTIPIKYDKGGEIKEVFVKEDDFVDVGDALLRIYPSLKKNYIEKSIVVTTTNKDKNKGKSVKLYEVAKELGLDNEEVFKKAQEIGLKVKTTLSSISKKDAGKLCEYIQNSASKSKEE